MRRVRRPGRTAERRPTPSSRSASLLLCLSPRRLTRADTTTASARRAASTSFLDRAVDLVERAPIVSSCAACAVPDAPPSADRRHPHVQLRCCSAYRRAGSLEPTRRRRARAEPRARRSLIAPPTSSTRADRVVVRRVRRPGRTAERRPTSSSRSASLLLCLSPRRLTRADTTTASARRAASTSFLDRAVDLVERAPIVPSCAACAVPDAPPSADRRHPHVQLRCCSAYRRAGSLEPTRRRRARAEPRARRSLIAPPTSSTRADRVVVRRVRRPGRTAERRPTPSSRSASLLLCLSPRRLTRADTTTASARRAASTSFLDRAVDLVDARRSCRRAPRAPSRTHRRAPTDVILTFSFVAALPIAAPAHSSRHDDGERAPSREHVVP